jgi:hypothetical protein
MTMGLTFFMASQMSLSSPPTPPLGPFKLMAIVSLLVGGASTLEAVANYQATQRGALDLWRSFGAIAIFHVGTGAGLWNRKRWAGLLFAGVYGCAGVALLGGVVMSVDETLMVLWNIPMIFLFLLPLVLTGRHWRQLR